MQPTVLLTGATGFIGSHLTKALLNQGFRVVALKQVDSDTRRLNTCLEQVQLVNYSADSLEEVFAELPVDIVVHLATHYLKQDDELQKKQMFASNVEFPERLIDVAEKYGVKGFINTGTFFEYDCKTQPVDETCNTNPFNFYAQTKLQCEEVIKSFSDRMLINTFRLFSPYGEADNPKLVPFIIQKNLNSEEFELSEGLQKIDLIYVKDIVSAYIKSIRRMVELPYSSEYEVFNLGSGRPLSIRDVVSIVEQTTGIKCKNTWGAPAVNEIPVAYANIEKAKKILDWQPEYTIFEGIANTVNYYKNKD